MDRWIQLNDFNNIALQNVVKCLHAISTSLGYIHPCILYVRFTVKVGAKLRCRVRVEVKIYR